MPREELYRSETIVVRRIACADISRWVITFDNFEIAHGFDRPGFSEAFLEKQGISAIHVLGRGIDWFHYPDVMAAAAVVKQATASAVRRLAYGSSMGGFAALRLADAVGADAVLAYSPQYSVDPQIVPWETRWIEQTHRLDRIAEFGEPLTCRCRPVIVFDSDGLDRLHADRIVADTPCVTVKIPFGAHPVTTFLSEARLLKPILMQVLDGTFSAEAVAKRVRDARRRSCAYLATLAERQPPSRLATAIRIARLSTREVPEGFLGYLALARLLTKAGEHAESLSVSQQMVTLSNREPLSLFIHAENLARAGNVAEAPIVAAEFLRTSPEFAHLRHWYAWMLFLNGDIDAAISEEERALVLHENCPLYLETLQQYRAAARRKRSNDKLRPLRRALRYMRRSIKRIVSRRA